MYFPKYISSIKDIHVMSLVRDIGPHLAACTRRSSRPPIVTYSSQ